MPYIIIPVQATANQEFACVLDNERAQIRLMTTDYGLFADVTYNGASVASGRLCEDRTDLNPDRYRGLPQWLGFVDTQGGSDPHFEGFGSRYFLIYGSPPLAPVGS